MASGELPGFRGESRPELAGPLCPIDAGPADALGRGASADEHPVGDE
jgi:hypothetical protein